MTTGPQRLRCAWAFGVTLALVSLAARLATADPPEDGGSRYARDPLVPMIHRIDRYIQQNESDGVMLDWRVAINATEAARLSVVPQLLAYAELNRVQPLRRFRTDIAQRADFLSARFGEFRSGSVFDGMLGYAFLEAYEATGNVLYLDRGRAIVDELAHIPHTEYVLNGGLMAAMAFAKYYWLTGDADAGALTHEILAGLAGYQHPDGSFPHWCVGSRDVHYTDWMSTELILIGRLIDDPVIDPMLARMRDFFEGRIDIRGITAYEEPCPGTPGCVVYYYSIATGCGIDEDTRAFTNELGYSVLLLDHAGSGKYPAVIRFLDSLETGGTIADKWDFPLTPDNPYYVWTAADTSVINASLILWSLSSALAGRPRHVAGPGDWERSEGNDDHDFGPPRGQRGGRGDDVSGPARPAPGGSLPQAPGSVEDPGRGPALRVTSLAPNPADDEVTIRFALSRRATVVAAIYDAGGRRERSLVSGGFEPGEHALQWDRRDDRELPCASGIYYVRIHAAGTTRVAPVILVR